MVTVTALVRVALRWQIKADGPKKIGQRLAEGTQRNVFRSEIHVFDVYLFGCSFVEAIENLHENNSIAILGKEDFVEYSYIIRLLGERAKSLTK